MRHGSIEYANLFVWSLGHSWNLLWLQQHGHLQSPKNLLFSIFSSAGFRQAFSHEWASWLMNLTPARLNGCTHTKCLMKWARTWPEGGLQVPGVAHKLSPVHSGVVDAVILVLVCRAFIVQGRGALLAWPCRKHSRGKKCWGHRADEVFSKELCFPCSTAHVFSLENGNHIQHPEVEHNTRSLLSLKAVPAFKSLSGNSIHIQIPICPIITNQD